jgi:hypothetical protein
MALTSVDRERAASVARPKSEQDAVVDEWLAAIRAASKPPEELLRDSLRTVLELQSERYLSEAEATELLKRIAAASVQRYVSDAIRDYLDPELIHGAARQRASRSFLMSKVRRHLRPELAR